MAYRGWESHRQGYDEDHKRRSRSRSAEGRRGRHYEQAAEDSRSSLPKAKHGQRWWTRSPERDSYVGVVPNVSAPVAERGKIIGDRGSNVKRIVDVMCHVLGHKANEHGRPPFVQFNERNGNIEFELELYPPFNNEDSFEAAGDALRSMMEEMRSNPWGPASRHCSRPKKIQTDDWDCPNPECGNLVFARRPQCPLCKTPKPKDWGTASSKNNVTDWDADANMARPPKHKMKVTSTKERLGSPEFGECQVVWLVPVKNRGYVIGKGGDKIRAIKEDTGADVVLTKEVETREVNGEEHCMVFLRGSPSKVNEALRMVSDAAHGSRLAEDGFEDVLESVEAELKYAGQGASVSLEDLETNRDVSRAMIMPDLKDSMEGAGLRSLMEVLEQFPERFFVQRNGPRGAVVKKPSEHDTKRGPGRPSWKQEQNWRGGYNDENSWSRGNGETTKEEAPADSNARRWHDAAVAHARAAVASKYD